ncbi:MAG: TonB-dependent siderophore receptor [Pseudomonadota bacterium]
MSRHTRSRLSSQINAPSQLRPLIKHLLGAGFVLVAGGAVAQTTTTTTANTAATGPALSEVTVNEKAIESLFKPYAGGQVSKGGTLGILGTQDIMDTPFSTVNYTSELLQNQHARTLADVVVNDASVRMTTGSGGFDDPYRIRGFVVNAGDVGLNGLYGLISSSRVPAQLLERVEILKGPGALMNGIAPSGTIGGTINAITKRASDVPLTRVTTTYQGKANAGLELDFGRRFGTDNAWGIRFNGVVRGGEATIRGGSQDGRLGALALDYQGSRVRWTLDLIQQEDDTSEFRPQISLLANTTAIPAPPDARTNWYPGTKLRQRDTTIATRVEYDITDFITTYAAVGMRKGSNFQTFPQTNAAGTGATGVNAAGDFRASNSYYDSKSDTTSGTAGLRWRFKTGNVGHTLTTGVTTLLQEAATAYSLQPGVSNVSNIYNPSPLPVITVNRLATAKASYTRLGSFAVADTLSFANDSILLTLGARHQTVDAQGYSTVNGSGTSKYKASSITPLAGIVYKPASNVSVYGNYTSALSQGILVGPGFANAGEILPPFKSNQVEGGVKVDFGSFTTTAALYRLSRPAITGTAPAARTYNGEERHHGLELSTFGELKRGLRAMASVAFISAKLAKTQAGLNQGNRPAAVPANNLSAGLDWDTPIEGFSINGRVVHTSRVYMAEANTLSFPGYERYDLGARYTTKVSGKPLVLRASIENVFNKNYWLSQGTYVGVGNPRTFLLSAAVDF